MALECKPFKDYDVYIVEIGTIYLAGPAARFMTPYIDNETHF